MSNAREFDKPRVYQIMVKGHLDAKWSDWFDGLAIRPQDDGQTILTGPVTDQPALHGMLAKICNLGLPLVQVQQMEPPEADPPNEQ
jgi:hypothetical protein